MSKKKKKSMKKKKKRRVLRIIRNILLILVILAAVVIIAALLWFKNTYGISVIECAQEAEQLVEESTEEDFVTNSASTIYSDDGTELADLYEDTESTYLTFDEIPTDVLNAFVAVEDRTFWTNSGIDVKGIIRVLFTYVKSGGDTAQGASTITQQLAREAFLTSEKSLERKVKEIFIALELTKKYSKEQILEYYCNNCCFANGIYGIEDASETYLGKEASELTLSEAAYLCAIPNRPEYYDPFDDSTTALTRRDKILEDMYECEFITSAELAEALEQEIEVVEEEEEDEFYNYETTYAIDCATEYLMEYLYGFEFEYEFATDEEYEEYHESYDETYANAKHKLYTGGYEIYTTISIGIQDKLQEILNEQLSFSTQTQEDSEIYNLQGAITVIDNDTGKVIAAVGGREQEELEETYSLNRAYQITRQPGSSIKPILVYTPALMAGYTADSMLTEIDVDTAKTSTSEKISAMTGTRYTLRNAVEKSRNGCAYYLYNELTPSYGMEFLYALHFAALDPDDLTLSPSLGGFTHGTNTTEMANAYSTLANHGVYTEADCLASILDSDGNEIYEEPESTQVYSEEAADQMVDILMGVITRGTASGLNWYSSTDTEAAGKTGTTNDYKDGWFCGMTPQYTVAVWVGNDDNTAVSNLTGSSYPASIWKACMLYLIDGQQTQYFDLTVSSKYTDASEEEEEEEEEETGDEEIEEEEETADVQGEVPEGIQGTITEEEEEEEEEPDQSTQEDSTDPSDDTDSGETQEETGSEDTDTGGETAGE